MELFYEHNGTRMYQGDISGGYGGIPDRSVHCVVTSPPYWGLRDYGVDGQLGLEKTPEEYVRKLVEGFREVRRVLRDDGTLWLNLGDCYQSGNRGAYGDSRTQGGKSLVQQSNLGSDTIGAPNRFPIPGLKPKDLVGIPWSVAFALRADGWYLRSEIIWNKANPMPESVTDRPTKAHEQIFLLSKNERYYYDAEAIKERASENSHARIARAAIGQKSNPDELRNGLRPRGCGPKSSEAGSGVKYNDSFSSAVCELVPSRNKRTVWTIATHPFPEAHFATFPPKLVEPCILAGTSEKGCCPECGKPWERQIEKNVRFESGSGKAGNLPSGKNGDDYEQALSGEYDIRMGPVTETKTLGWQPACSCGKDPIPCTVLDPFCGSGTVGMVAQSLGRKSILIDLKLEYLSMAIGRLESPPKKGKR